MTPQRASLSRIGLAGTQIPHVQGGFELQPGHVSHDNANIKPETAQAAMVSEISVT
jgi:hypothetical protein